jgi:hypothetical protein
MHASATGKFHEFLDSCGVNEEAVVAPRSRFHPVPTRPVFAPLAIEAPLAEEMLPPPEPAPSETETQPAEERPAATMRRHPKSRRQEANEPLEPAAEPPTLRRAEDKTASRPRRTTDDAEGGLRWRETK